MASIPRSIARRPIAPRHSPQPGFPAVTGSGRSGGCGRRRAPTCSSPPCAGCCRDTRTSPPSWSDARRSSSSRSSERLRGMVAEAGLAERVRFLGELPIEEVPRWYQRISIYAFTSREEGFGLTLLEAMAAGTALVAARSGAAETVVADGATGVLVPPGDVDAAGRRWNR